MLAGKGFSRVYNLSGGIKAWEKATAIGPEDLGMEFFTGKEIKVMEYSPDIEQADVSEQPHSASTGPEREGWGVEYDYHEEYHEVEQMDFSASGTVVTADGKEISFSLDLSMSREFHESSSIQIRAGDARLVDPLIINYDGPAADLTDTKFSFDLDNDG